MLRARETGRVSGLLQAGPEDSTEEKPTEGESLLPFVTPDDMLNKAKEKCENTQKLTPTDVKEHLEALGQLETELEDLQKTDKILEEVHNKRGLMKDTNGNVPENVLEQPSTDQLGKLVASGQLDEYFAGKKEPPKAKPYFTSTKVCPGMETRTMK